MRKAKVLPLVTTTPNDDGSYETVFFDYQDSEVKLKRSSAADWRQKITVARVAAIIGPTALRILSSLFSETFQGVAATIVLVGIFILVGGSVAYLLHANIRQLECDTQVRDVFNHQDFLNEQSKRLLFQIVVIWSLRIISTGLLFVIFLSQVFSVTVMVVFMMVSFLFWTMLLQPLTRRILLYRSLVRDSY